MGREVGGATGLFASVPRGESQKKSPYSAAKDQGKKRNEEWSCFGEKEQLINSEEI